jgi:hypothetical protein
MSYLIRNVETGHTLTEEDHFARHADFGSGEVRDTDQSWHDRDENGRLVLTGAGLSPLTVRPGRCSATPPTPSRLRRDELPALGGSPA